MQIIKVQDVICPNQLIPRSPTLAWVRFFFGKLTSLSEALISTVAYNISQTFQLSKSSLLIKLTDSCLHRTLPLKGALNPNFLNLTRKKFSL